MTKPAFAAIALTVAMVLTITANAQNSPTPEERAMTATETRQAVFKLVGYNMGAISAMARGEAEFDADIVERNARRIEAMAPMIAELFESSDTRDFDVDTRALPGIWENQDDFRSKAQALVDAAGAFAQLASGGDRMQVIGGVRAFGATCGNCHDSYRAD